MDSATESDEALAKLRPPTLLRRLGSFHSATSRSSASATVTFGGPVALPGTATVRAL